MSAMKNPIMQSPVSPYANSRHSLSPHAQQSYLSVSPHPAEMPLRSTAPQGLGLYTDTMPSTASSNMDTDSYSQSSSALDEPVSGMDMFYEKFDPFKGFEVIPQTDLLESTPGLEYCRSPQSSTQVSSQRSSYSAAAAQRDAREAYLSPNSVYDSSPHIKVENEAGEWFPNAAHEVAIRRAMSAAPGGIVYPSTTLASHTEDLYRTQSADWSMNDTAKYVDALHSDSRMNRGFDVGTLPSANRIKKKRQRTTVEEATHECRLCGKLFKRSYNWKSHMETHNPDRKYPHPCTAMNGNSPCTKKFQRKTDLDRHYDSVHLKAKNHKCDLCGNRFARRDTLRRHTEDGCPKRFEFSVREPTDSSRWGYPNYSASPGPQRTYSMAVSSSSSPPMSMRPTQSSTFPLYNNNNNVSRPEFTSPMGVMAPTAFAA
ncbi:hypothetical protein MMC25_005489 [Agyrium rufum]|nr:hypothetical protein [Agyrium rufum]